MRRAGGWVLTLLCVLVCLCLPAAAEAETGLSLPDEYGALPEHLPAEIYGLLPDGLFSSDPSEAADALEDMTGLPDVLSLILTALGLRLPEAASLLSLLLGLILTGYALNRLSETMGGRAGAVTGLAIRLSLCAAAAGLTDGLIRTVTTFFGQLADLSGGLAPVCAALLVMGGDLSRAAVVGSLSGVFVSLLNLLAAKTAPAVCAVCMVLTLFEVGDDPLHTAALSEAVKKAFAWFLGLSMFLLSAVLGTQTLLAAGRDSLRMRGMRYAVGQMIPVVGGAVSASLGSLTAGIGILRRICGAAGLCLLGLLLLPTLTELLLFRLVLSLASTAASFLSCPAEAGLLKSIAGLYGYMAAAAAVCSVFLTLSLALPAAGSV